MRVFGKKKHLRFKTDDQYYETLGFLAQARYTRLRWEHNEDQGAWGSEGRIHCRGNLSVYPSPLKRVFTAGNGSIKKRVNCNEFVQHIRHVHHFGLGWAQNVPVIRATVPAGYLAAFDRGTRL